MKRVCSLVIAGLAVVGLAAAWVLPTAISSPAPRFCAIPGDMNCDGVVNCDDINPFVLALSDPEEWQRQYPGCPISNGDVNGDGVFDFDDINPFDEAIDKRPIKGDANCDGCINEADINPFVLALSNPCLYKQTFIGCPFLNNDVNGDGLVNFGDINPFNDLLKSKEIKGDMNCDRCVNGEDVNPFVLAMSGEDAYLAQYPDCVFLNADINDDGLVNFDDINPFNELITPPCH